MPLQPESHIPLVTSGNSARLCALSYCVAFIFIHSHHPQTSSLTTIPASSHWHGPWPKLPIKKICSAKFPVLTSEYYSSNFELYLVLLFNKAMTILMNCWVLDVDAMALFYKKTQLGNWGILGKIEPSFTFTYFKSTVLFCHCNCKL
jgi:hypothetical protein